MAGRRPVFDFAALVTSIQEADARLAAHAIRAVNFGLTLRNWMIGFYIAEFELRGLDRAAYGDRLLIELSKALSSRRISNTGRRQLYHYLSFYRIYPQIVRTLPAQFRRLLPPLPTPRIVRTAPALSGLAPDKLFSRLSFGMTLRPAVTRSNNHPNLCCGSKVKQPVSPLVPRLRSQTLMQPVAETLRHNSPITVAGWKTKLVEKLPKELKGSLPTVEEIEAELAEYPKSAPRPPRSKR